MQLLPILTAVAEQSIPGRPATWQESLRLMGAGWGSIFIVILVIMLCVYLLFFQWNITKVLFLLLCYKVCQQPQCYL